MIVGKKVTEENEPVVYSTPFDTIIDILDLQIDESTKSLLANCPEYESVSINEQTYQKNKFYYLNNENEYILDNGDKITSNRKYYEKLPISITLLDYKNYEQPYYGFSRLALRADFRSWLRETGCVAGDYGLKVTIDFVADIVKTTDENNEENKSYQIVQKELYLNVEDMIGSPYQFDTFFTQEKAFDISMYGGIGAIKIEFYQTSGSFLTNKKNESGNNILVSYKDDFSEMLLPDNLFIRNCQIAIGYDLSDYNNDFVQLYCFEQPSYSSKEDSKNIKLKWIHLNGEEQIVMPSEKCKDDYEIRWYRYVQGEPSADGYVSSGWIDIDNELNKGTDTDEAKRVFYRQNASSNKQCYEVILHPDSSKQDFEEIKAIILFGEEPGYLEYNFPDNTYEAFKEYSKNKARYYIKENKQYINCANKNFNYITYYTQCSSEDNYNSSQLYYKIIFSEEGKQVAEKEFIDNPGKYYIKKDNNDGYYYDNNYDATKTYFTIKNLGLQENFSETMFNSGKTQYYAKTYEEPSERLNYYIKETDIRKIYRTKSIVFSNDKDVSGNMAIDVLSALSLNCFDDNGVEIASSYGNYLLYEPGGAMVENIDKIIQRGIRCSFDLRDTETEDTYLLEEADSITWIVPNSHTMINSINFVSQPDEILYLNSNLDEIAEGNSAEYRKIVYKTKSKIQEQMNSKYQAPCLLYGLNSTFTPNRGNNTIQCIIEIEGLVYTASKELTFGQYSTAGTDYRFELELETSVLTAGIEETIEVRALLYDKYGELLDISNKNIEWKFVNPADSEQTIDSLTNLTLENNVDGKTYLKTLKNRKVNINTICIIQATLQDWEDYELIAYKTVPIRSDKKYVDLEGATEVIYLTDGTLYYNSTTPYKVFKTEGTEIKTETILEWTRSYGEGYKKISISQEEFDDNKTNYYTYNSENDIYNKVKSTDTYQEKTSYFVLTESNVEKYSNYYPTISNYNESDKNRFLKPVNMFINGMPLMAIQAKVNSNVIIWTQPILIIQNRYPVPMVNKWDGLSLKIDKENGSILGRMIGAGRKEEDNSFSGVLMGGYTQQSLDDINLKTSTGLFGFNKGVQCFSFTDDGKATIGKNTGAQLIFDGNESTITSASYKTSNAGIEMDFDDATINLENNGYFIKLDASKDNLELDDNVFSIGLNNNANFKIDWQGNATMTDANIRGLLQGECRVPGSYDIGENSKAMEDPQLADILARLAFAVSEAQEAANSAYNAALIATNNTSNTNSTVSLLENHFWQGTGGLYTSAYKKAEGLTEKIYKLNRTIYYRTTKGNTNINDSTVTQCESTDAFSTSYDYYIKERTFESTQTINIGYEKYSYPYIKLSSSGVGIVKAETTDASGKKTSTAEFMTTADGFRCLGSFRFAGSIILDSHSYGPKSVIEDEGKTWTEGQVFFALKTDS